MRETVILLIALCVLLVWLAGVHILMRILELAESRSESRKDKIDVRVTGYSEDSKPPTVIAETEHDTVIYLKDYDRLFKFSAQVYYNHWVRVELVDHYYGIIFIHITKKIHSLVPIYK